jgi:hypothetical protein
MELRESARQQQIRAENREKPLSIFEHGRMDVSTSNRLGHSGRVKLF